jgi:hypothetical protein
MMTYLTVARVGMRLIKNTNDYIASRATVNKNNHGCFIKIIFYYVKSQESKNVSLKNFKKRLI